MSSLLATFVVWILLLVLAMLDAVNGKSLTIVLFDLSLAWMVFIVFMYKGWQEDIGGKNGTK